MALTVLARSSGSWVPAAPTELAGRFVERGELLAYVAAAGMTQRVRVAVTQEDGDLVRSRGVGAAVWLAQRPEQALPARLIRQVPGGGFDLVAPALGSSGSGVIAVEPSKEGGTRSLHRVFDMEMQLDGAPQSAVFGERAKVRFDLGNTPLAYQWWLRQAFLSRLNI